MQTDSKDSRMGVGGLEAAWAVTEFYVVEEVWDLLIYETVQVQDSCGNNLQLLVFSFCRSG